MRSRRPSFALLASVASVAATVVPACGSEETASRTAGRDETSRPGAAPTTKAESACVPRRGGHARICGLAPPHRRAGNEVAYKLTTVGGESFWVILPDELARPSGVVAVPGVPLRVNAELTTAPARAAAARYCDGFPACEPTVVSRERLPEPLIRWDDASRSIGDLAVTTLELGPWTLVLSEPDASRAGRVGRAIRSSVDADGYPRLASAMPGVPIDHEWAGVLLWVVNSDKEHYLIHVIPGCELSSKEPDLGGSDAGPALELHEPETVAGGRWCVAGRYWVDVTFADRPRLELLHTNLRVVPAAG